MSTVRAAAHLHSDWSYDATWPLARLADTLARRGYRVALMTEHDKGFSPERLREFRSACAAASNERILVVPGIEYSDAENLVHILTWGDVPFLGEGAPTLDTLTRVRDAGGVSVMAHPSRKNAWREVTPAWAERLTAIELWNRKSDGWAPSRDAARLALEHGLPVFAGMDFHRSRQLWPLAIDLEIEGVITEASVIAGLRSGRWEAKAWGVPVSWFASGAIGGSARAAEWVRRNAARNVRRAIGRPA